MQRDVAICLTRIADLLAKGDEIDAAIAAYREGLDISRALVAIDPTIASWQRDLSVALDRIGDVTLAQGHAGNAEAMYRESLGIRRALSDREPGKALYRRDMYVSLTKVGDAQLAQDDLPGALASYREAVQVTRALVASRSDGASWQGDLNYSVGRIGTLAYHCLLARDFAQALALSDEAISAAPDLVWLQSNRAHALMFLGRVDEARALYLAHRGEQKVQNNKSWDALVLEDFADLRKIGLTHALMDEVARRFTAAN